MRIPAHTLPLPPRLIFVAHSMGGLLVKKAYTLGHQEPEFQPVVDRVLSIVFLGTPHQSAAIARTLARLVALMGNRPFVDDLLPQSPMSQSINEDFPQIAGKIQLMSFYETRPMSVGRVKAMIVEKNSAVMNSPNERRTLLDADHRNLAMFSSANEPAFVTVRNALATIISSHRDESNARKQQVEQRDQTSLDKFLGISSAPEDDIMTQDFSRLPGSCQWLFGDPVVPKAFSYTADRLRLNEIRGQQCRVWEPTVLLRTDTKDEENSDTVSISTDPQELDYHESKDVAITAIACARIIDVVFYGTTEGCVYACNITGEPQSLLAFVEIRDCPFHLLYFGATACILTSGDRSGLVTSRKLLRRTVSRQNSPREVSEPHLDFKATEHAQDTLINVISSASFSRIITSTEKYDTLRDASKMGRDVVAQLESDPNSRWLPHPTKSECLLRISQTQFHFYNWTDLQLVSTISPLALGSVGRLISLQHAPGYFAIASVTSDHVETTKHLNQVAFSEIQVWDSKDMDTSSSINPVQRLDRSISDQIELIIGAFGFRMVLLTKDHWVASVDLQASEDSISSRQPLIRHFFLPNDWIAVDHKRLLLDISHSGEIVFAKHSELAVIRRGLEIMETGASFNPQRGSAVGIRSSLSVRSRGPSPGPSLGSSRPSLG